MYGYGPAVATVALYVLAALVGIFVAALIFRWILGTGRIVALLEQIAAQTAPQTQAEQQIKCPFCAKTFSARFGGSIMPTTNCPHCGRRITEADLRS